MNLLDAVERSVDVIHGESGVIWGDGNLRNIMLEVPHGGQTARKKGKAWIIDFGGSTDIESAEDPKTQRANALLAIRRLKAQFGSRSTRQRDSERPGMKESDRNRLTKGGRAVEAYAKTLIADVDANEILPLHLVVHRLQRSFDWVDLVGPVLYRVAASDPTRRRKITESLTSWTVDENARVQMRDARLHADVLKLISLLENQEKTGESQSS
ncbi:MAG: hypothetical protein V1745_02625 [Patescibacteria group bacterium]